MGKRMLHDRICGSDKIAKLGNHWGAAFLWCLLLTHTDDWGDVPDNAVWVKAQCYPKKPKLNVWTVKNWLELLVEVELLTRYTDENGDKVLHVAAFDQYQTLRSPRPKHHNKKVVNGSKPKVNEGDEKFDFPEPMSPGSSLIKSDEGGGHRSLEVMSPGSYPVTGREISDLGSLREQNRAEHGRELGDEFAQAQAQSSGISSVPTEPRAPASSSAPAPALSAPRPVESERFDPMTYAVPVTAKKSGTAYTGDQVHRMLVYHFRHNKRSYWRSVGDEGCGNITSGKRLASAIDAMWEQFVGDVGTDWQIPEGTVKNTVHNRKGYYGTKRDCHYCRGVGYVLHQGTSYQCKCWGKGEWVDE
jgi:hypothetical protein